MIFWSSLNKCSTTLWWSLSLSSSNTLNIKRYRKRRITCLRCWSKTCVSWRYSCTHIRKKLNLIGLSSAGRDSWQKYLYVHVEIFTWNGNCIISSSIAQRWDRRLRIPGCSKNINALKMRQEVKFGKTNRAIISAKLKRYLSISVKCGRILHYLNTRMIRSGKQNVCGFSKWWGVL